MTMTSVKGKVFVVGVVAQVAGLNMESSSAGQGDNFAKRSFIKFGNML